MLTITDFINILHRYYKSPMVSMAMSCYRLLDCTQTEIANCLKNGLLLFLSFWKLSFVRSNLLSSFEREDSFVVKVVGWYQDTWVQFPALPMKVPRAWAGNRICLLQLYMYKHEEFP